MTVFSCVNYQTIKWKNHVSQRASLWRKLAKRAEEHVEKRSD